MCYSTEIVPVINLTFSALVIEHIFKILFFFIQLHLIFIRKGEKYIEKCVLDNSMIYIFSFLEFINYTERMIFFLKPTKKKKNSCVNQILSHSSIFCWTDKIILLLQQHFIE